MNNRSRSRYLVETHSLFLDMQRSLELWPRLQSFRCHRLKPKPPPRPPRPRRRPQRRRSPVQSGDRSGEAGERNGVRNDAPGAQSGDRSGAQDATNDGTLATAPPPPSKKSKSVVRATRQPARVSAGRSRKAHTARPSFQRPPISRLVPTSRPMAQFANKNNQPQPEPAKRERTIPRWQGLGSQIHG